MATPAAKAQLAAQALQRLGYHQNESWVTKENNKHLSNENETLFIQKNSPNAKTPKKDSPTQLDMTYPSTSHPLLYNPLNYS